jgi:hypothetical protein
MVQEVEDQRLQHLQRRRANGATMPARLVRAAVEGARLVQDRQSGISAATAIWPMARMSTVSIQNQ